MKKENRAQNLPYVRLLYIDEKIASGGFPNSTSLAKAYEVSAITIKRDIELMKDQLSAPIDYDSHRRGYYYTQPRFRLPALFATQEELIASGIISKVMAQYRGTPLYKQIKHIFAGLNSVLCGSAGQIRDPLWFEKHLSFLEESVPVFDENVWNTIMSAMFKNRYIDFTYRGAWKTEERHYVLAPYQLVCRRGVWYCAAYSDLNQKVALYALNRFRSIRITQKSFTFPAGYDYAKDQGGSFGVFSRGKTYQCRVLFFEEAVTYISEREWAPNQHIEWQDDGSIILDFETSQLYETLTWILSQGPNALPLEPPELRSQWETAVKTMAKISEIPNE